MENSYKNVKITKVYEKGKGKRRYFMLLKSLVAAIIGGIIFPFVFKLLTYKKQNNNYFLQGLIFAFLFFIILLVIKPYS